MSSVRRKREGSLETIAAMLSMESKNYRLNDYFPPDVMERSDGLPRQQNVIHGAWREKICQWSYNVVDHYKLPREIVSISINFFDRFMATLSTPEEASHDTSSHSSSDTHSKSHASGSVKNSKNGSNGATQPGDLALLASLGTLHLATKVHLTNHNDYDPELGPIEEQHHRIPSMQSLAMLSRGQFGPDSIVEMEKSLLRALNWKLHPPTLFFLINMLLELIPTTQEDPNDGIKKSIRDDLFEAAMYLAELSVCDVFFVEHQIPSSTIALAAICTAMDNLLSFPTSTCSNNSTSMMAGFDARHLRGSGCFSNTHRRIFLDTCADRLGLGCRDARERTRFQQSLERLLAIHKGAEEAGHLDHMEEAEATSPTNPQDELQQQCRANCYNPPTSPASITEMSMSSQTVNSCMHSMAEANLKDREGLKLGDSTNSIGNSSMPTRNESMMSSIDCSSHSNTAHTSAKRINSMMSVSDICGRDTPERGDDLTSSCNNSKDFRYSPSPKNEANDHDSNGDCQCKHCTCQEDTRVADFRRRVEDSCGGSCSSSNHHNGEIYYEPSGIHHQPQEDSQRKKKHFDNSTAMMSCSPIVVHR
mmetsp:Transcript_20972/g.45626  ORF Transcript_20972/g.45626 Transcript_20972/m.45626 type:complete len:590 (+) Transcript_20972:196-1965(+)